MPTASERIYRKLLDAATEEEALVTTEMKAPFPGHLIAEVDTAALTVFNPINIACRVCVTANWLPFAHSVLGYSTPGLGVLMAAAGLTTWFTALTVIVRFIPHRIGPNFFRLINAILGFATFCAIVLSRHIPR